MPQYKDRSSKLKSLTEEEKLKLLKSATPEEKLDFLALTQFEILKELEELKQTIKPKETDGYCKQITKTAITALGGYYIIVQHPGPPHLHPMGEVSKIVISTAAAPIIADGLCYAISYGLDELKEHLLSNNDHHGGEL